MEVLYFTASWCAPCKVFGPIMEEIGETENITRIDIQEKPEFLDKYDVMSVPTLVLLRDGEEKARLLGAQSETVVRAWIKTN